MLAGLGVGEALVRTQPGVEEICDLGIFVLLQENGAMALHVHGAG